MALELVSKTGLDEALKNLYAEWEIEQLVNLTNPALAQCAPEGSAEIGGAGFYFAVRTQGAYGHAYIGETDDLPAGQRTVIKQALVDPTVHAGVVQLTGLSVSITASSAMSFAKAFDENVQQTLESMACYKEGVLFRGGDGVLATFTTDEGAITGPHPVSDTAYLRIGMHVDVIDATAFTRHNTDLVVADIDWVNSTVTFETAVDAAVAATDEIYIADSQGAAAVAPVSLEPVGFEGAFSNTGNYLGIARASNPNWKSEVITVNGFLDEDVIMRARTRLTQRAGIQIGQISRSMRLVCHPMQGTVLFKLAIPKIRYTGNDMFDLGNSDEVKFGTMPLTTSYMCPTTSAYMGDFSSFNTLYAPGGKLHIDTEYNGSALKWVSTKDQGIVFAKEYAAFACRRPNQFVVLNSLLEATR